MIDESKYLFRCDADWTFDLLEKTWVEIEKIAAEDLEMINGVDYYKPVCEIVSSEQMLDAYSAVGMPNFYDHWSFGKQFVHESESYKKGEMGLAYEIIINSSPSLALLMADNDMTMQTLVMAHASVGHGFCFKTHYLFKEGTDAEGILDYIDFAKNYIRKCEEKYGEKEVELVLDACHALQNYGVDTYKRKHKKSLSQEASELQSKIEFEDELQNYDDVARRTLPPKIKKTKDDVMEPQENILYFIEKYAPTLPQWKREIIRIVRKMAVYWSPQMKTKVVNEGIATFTHYFIMNRLEEKGLIDAGSMIKFLASHTGVVAQQSWLSPYYSGFNPYTLGFSILMDVKRICENPTEEDKKWFPNLIGQRWLDAVKFASTNFTDENFILQYLSPTVIRKLHLFEIEFNTDESSTATVIEIHDEEGYKKIRAALANTYSMINRRPNIQVTDADLKGSRTLTLRYFPYQNRDIQPTYADDVIQYIGTLWEFDVDLVQEINLSDDDEEGEKTLHLITFFDSTIDENGNYKDPLKTH